MYYPDQNNVSKLTTIRRQCKLPENAIGKVRVVNGTPVDIRDVVAHGAIPNRHIILDGAAFFGLKDPEKLNELMLVSVGKAVSEGDPIAGKDRGRGKRLFSPMDGLLSGVVDGKIAIQEMPELIDLQAGVKGQVVQILQGRGVTIEAIGAQIQGVWGNGDSVIASLRMEPENGLAGVTEEQLDMRYVGAVVVTRKPLEEVHLAVAEEQNIAGIIAPSMDATLIDRVLSSDVAVMLTEGFGRMRMPSAVYNLLEELKGQQVTLDAHYPTRWEPNRPSAIVNYRTDEEPPAVNYMLALHEGMRVRINRAPYVGQQGRVVSMPQQPVLLENGLRLPCAIVDIRGQEVPVPLADIEVAGR